MTMSREVQYVNSPCLMSAHHARPGYVFPKSLLIFCRLPVLIYDSIR